MSIHVIRDRFIHTTQSIARNNGGHRVGADRPEFKNKANSPTAVHHLVRASSRNDGPSHRRSLLIYPIGIAAGKSSVPIGSWHFGVGLLRIVLVLSIAVLVLDRQALVCLHFRVDSTPIEPCHQMRIPENGGQMTSGGPVRVSIKRQKNHGHKKHEKTQKKKWAVVVMPWAGWANDTDHVVAANDYPLQ